MAYVPAEPARGAEHTAVLLISCPDGPGIVAAVSRFLFELDANIVSSDQYSTHPEHGAFFMRTAFYAPALDRTAPGSRPPSRSWPSGSRWTGACPMRASAAGSR